MKKKILFILLLALVSSCDDEISSPVPNAEVNIKLYLNHEDMNLTGKLSYTVFTSRRKESDKIGYGGVLVINGFGDTPHVNLYAFDLSCPVEVSRTVRLVPDNEGHCVCPKCGTKYDIGYGNGRPVSGEGTSFMRSYRVVNTGNSTYLVKN